MVKESYKDLERLNELNIKAISNATKEIEALKKDGKYLIPDERKKIVNRTVLTTLEL